MHVRAASLPFVEQSGEIFRFAVVKRDSTGGGPCPQSPLVAVVDALHPSEALMFA